MLTYAIPYIAIGYEQDGALTADLKDIKPQIYTMGEVQKGYNAFTVNPPISYSVPNGNELNQQGIRLSFVGWAEEDGKLWNFAFDKVQKDTVLYSVWSDKDNNLYKAMKYTDPETGLEICNSVREGTEVFNNP